jgi:hypothetical protein
MRMQRRTLPDVECDQNGNGTQSSQHALCNISYYSLAMNVDCCLFPRFLLLPGFGNSFLHAAHRG